MNITITIDQTADEQRDAYVVAGILEQLAIVYRESGLHGGVVNVPDCGRLGSVTITDESGAVILEE